MIAGQPLTFICCGAALPGPGLWAPAGYGSAPLDAFNVASLASAVAALASVVDLSSSSTEGLSSTWISQQCIQFQSTSDQWFSWHISRADHRQAMQVYQQPDPRHVMEQHQVEIRCPAASRRVAVLQTYGSAACAWTAGQCTIRCSRGCRLQQSYSSQQDLLASFLGSALLHKPFSKGSHVVSSCASISLLDSLHCLHALTSAQCTIRHLKGTWLGGTTRPNCSTDCVVH